MVDQSVVGLFGRARALDFVVVFDGRVARRAQAVGVRRAGMLGSDVWRGGWAAGEAETDPLALVLELVLERSVAGRRGRWGCGEMTREREGRRLASRTSGVLFSARAHSSVLRVKAYLGSIRQLVRRDRVPLASQCTDVLLVHYLSHAIAIVLSALACVAVAVAIGAHGASMGEIVHVLGGRVQRRRGGRCSWSTWPARGFSGRQDR